MKGIQKRLGSLLMAAVMLLSLAVTPAMAADTQNPPTEVTNCEAGGIWTTVLALGFSDTAWMNAINAVLITRRKSIAFRAPRVFGKQANTLLMAAHKVSCQRSSLL